MLFECLLYRKGWLPSRSSSEEVIERCEFNWLFLPCSDDFLNVGFFERELIDGMPIVHFTEVPVCDGVVLEEVFEDELLLRFNPGDLAPVHPRLLLEPGLEFLIHGDGD